MYLKLKNITLQRDDFSLHVNNLEIEKGCFFGVLGHSGAGKSTLLNLICGLEELDNGEIILDSQNITSKKPNERDIAYVFQNSLLFESLSVKENLAYILQAKGIEKKSHVELIQTALKDSEAEHLIDRDVTGLSGGEKQRVALAMALMFKPKLLILDEPFSNLDTTLKIKMRTFIKTLIKKHHITTLMVTHDKDDAFYLFDEMMLLENGKVLQVSSPQKMYENPNSIKCAKYFGMQNIFHGTIKDEVFTDKQISLHVKSKDREKAVMIIPQNAITITEGNNEKVQSATYIEGRWQMQLENSLIFYAPEKLENVNLHVDTNRCILLGDEEC